MLKPFFGYFGGKYRDALKHYPPPKYSTIYAPFAGSLGYETRYADRRVIACDLDPVIVGVWNYLLRASPSEILSLPDVPMDGCIDDLSVCQEARWLIGFWCTKGNAYPAKTPSAWMRTGEHHASFWGSSIRDRLARQVPQIRHWRVHHCSWADMAYNTEGTWFIDPPYQRQGKRYRCSSRGINYRGLAEWCRSRPGQVIVCEQAGADWLPFKHAGKVRATRKNTFSHEVVWTKG